MNCEACQKPLSGGVDTYGDPGGPEFCFECWSDLTAQIVDDFYGVAPHVHNLARTGTFIGSTEPVALPEPNADGWIDLGAAGGWYVNWMFKQDEEGPGCGVYVHKSKFAAQKPQLVEA